MPLHPPALDDRARYNVVVLKLERAPDGWRVHDWGDVRHLQPSDSADRRWS